MARPSDTSDPYPDDGVEILSINSGPPESWSGPSSADTASVETTGTSTSFDIERRSLWPILAFTALIAVALVVSSTRSSTTDDVGDESASPTTAPAQNASPSSDGQSVSARSTERTIEPLGGLSADDRFYIVPIPISNFSAFEPNVVTLGADEFQGRALDFQMFAGGISRQLYPGIDRHPLLATNQGLVAVGIRKVFLQDPDLSEPAVEIAEGIGVLAGPNDNSVWILGSAERTVELYDLSNRRRITVHSMEDKGRPVASVDSGIILADRTISPGNDFVFWDPIHGLIELVGTDDVQFFGANGSKAVFGSADELIVFDVGNLNMHRREELVTDGKLEGTRVAADIGMPWGSSLSPDGSLLALVTLTPVTEPNVISLIETDTGEVRDTITNALQIQYQWSGPDTLVYMLPDWPSVILAERDSRTGVDRQLVWLSDLTWWYTIDTATNP